MNLPKSVFNYILVLALLLLAGILFANTVLVLVSIVPFIFLLAGNMLKLPGKVEIKRVISGEKLYAGEVLTVSVYVSIKTGIGIVSLCDILPENFQLVKGSNVIVITKGLGEKHTCMSYDVICNSTGEFTLNNIKCEAKHILYDYRVLGNVSKEQKINILPRIFSHSKIKSISGASKIPMPLNAFSRIGIPTLDFKEVRLYSNGDSFKYINWKASSRNIYKGYFWPVVNEYDKEGKKIVWIFLDGSKEMEYGTNLKNVFDSASEAACQLANYYIKQQCMTGFCTYNTESACVYPGSGKKQYYKILNEVLKLSSAKGLKEVKGIRRNVGLRKALITHRSHFAGTKPLFVIITRYTLKDYNEMDFCLKEFAKYLPVASGNSHILVINIVPYSLSIETNNDKLAVELLNLKDSKMSANLKKRCIWVNWDPAKNNLFDAILRQVV